MKSTHNTNQNNNFQFVSKKVILCIGIVTVLFVNATSANTIVKEQQNLEREISTETVVLNSNLEVTTNNDEVIVLQKPTINSEIEIGEIALLENNSNQLASIIETINENKRIIENEDEINQPLYLDRTIEQIIDEDNQIIESTVDNTNYPLDFKIINKYQNALIKDEIKNRKFKKAVLKS